jgi:hypothetical protein
VFVHFQPVNHERINQQDKIERTQKKKADGMGSSLLGLLGGSATSNAKDSTKTKKGYIGGHEQSNHEDEHVKLHIDAIDAETDAAAAEQLRMIQEQEEARLDAKAAALKAALDAELAAAEQQDQGDAEAEGGGDNLSAEEREARHAEIHDPDARFNRAFTQIEDLKSAEEQDRDHRVYEAMRDAASDGNKVVLAQLLKSKHADLLHNRDENGWQLLHEAIRGGDLDTVKMLVDLGADVRVKVYDGGAALWVARSYLEEDNPIIQYLVDIGAPEEEEL